MKYFEVTFTVQPCNETITDVLSGLTADIGFESFVECENGMKAYGRRFSDTRRKHQLFHHGAGRQELERGMGEEFLPAHRHRQPLRDSQYLPQGLPEGRIRHRHQYDIVINPQMAFGTGHHETTSSILGELLEADLKGKSVLDMGCGTSILAILASMRGAGKVTAIDIDDWCVNNSRDNIALNGISNITVELGDASLLNGREPFDVVIANINRNILLQDMPAYAACMKKGSELYISGFYTEDIPVLREKAESLGMEYVHHREKHNWAAVKFIMK